MAEKINKSTILTKGTKSSSRTKKPKSVKSPREANKKFYEPKRKIPKHPNQTAPESKDGSRGWANPKNASDSQDFKKGSGKFYRSGKMLEKLAREQAVKAANRSGKRLAKKGK